MGVYEICCSVCDKPFTWWSGNRHQICEKCIKKLGGGVFEVYRRFKNPKLNHPVACYYYIGYNEAESYEEAIELLIERGVPENEIVKD